MTKQNCRRSLLAFVAVMGVTLTFPARADRNDDYVIPGKELSLEELVGAQRDTPGPDRTVPTDQSTADTQNVATAAPKSTLVDIEGASFRLPEGWKSTYDSPSDKMFESPDGKISILAFWWFPDEPLTGYQDETSVKHVTIDHESVTRITSRIGQTLSIMHVSERARADEKRLIFKVESSAIGMEALQAVTASLIQDLRLQPALDPGWKDTGSTAPPPPPAQVVDQDRFKLIDAKYAVYENGRYGTVISYPFNFFLPEPPPENGDGRRFSTTDGTAGFYVFAQFNALGQSQQELIQQDKNDPAHGNVSYEKFGPGWYVLSGTTAGDIFYRRVTEDSNGLIQVFEIRYPIARKSDFDAIVTYMANSFGRASGLVNKQPSGGGQPSVNANTAPDSGHASVQKNASDRSIGWWIIVGTFPTDPWQRQQADFERMQSIAASCNLNLFNDLSGKFRGFSSGYNVFVVGAFESKSVAINKLQDVQECFPDAYAKFGEYLGE